MASHENHMDEALALAARGRGWVSPNPMVGALVVKDGIVVGRGWHQTYGGPHAEVFALNEAGERARGATLYATLEPCNHTGKTPPCARAVIASGISRVVLGARETHPLASGGIATLAAAGIDVISGIREPECRALNAAFFKHIKTRLPFVSLKWAMSADGRIATRTDSSQWITGPPARDAAHRLRAEHDAVLVGINTLIADGARLTCRAASGAAPVRQPRRIILDSLARTPLDAPLWSEPEGGAILIIAGCEAPADRVDALKAKGAEVVIVADATPRPSIAKVLGALGERRIQSVLVEGGSTILGAFVDEGLVDHVIVFLAPKLIGGKEARPAVGGLGIAHINEALQLHTTTLRLAGSDIIFTGRMGAWDW